MDGSIDSFFGEYRFLSNFWPAPIELFGITFPTVEHAYVYAKIDGNTDPASIRLKSDIRHRLEQPDEVKRAGMEALLRPDWNYVRLPIMTMLVSAKFNQHPDLGEKLVATGQAQLTEGNHWHDNFWGECSCASCDGISKQNNLGLILMAVRANLGSDKQL